METLELQLWVRVYKCLPLKGVKEKVCQMIQNTQICKIIHGVLYLHFFIFIFRFFGKGIVFVFIDLFK